MATEERVERVARAMHEGAAGFDPQVTHPKWEELAGWCQEAMRWQARAAIADLDAEWEQCVAGAVRLLTEAGRTLHPQSRVHRALALLTGEAQGKG